MSQLGGRGFIRLQTLEKKIKKTKKDGKIKKQIKQNFLKKYIYTVQGSQ